MIACNSGQELNCEVCTLSGTQLTGNSGTTAGVAGITGNAKVADGDGTRSGIGNANCLV